VAHTLEVGSWLEANLDLAEASLVLFASRRQMREVYDRVGLALRDCILLQDHFAKQELLRLHRDASTPAGLRDLRSRQRFAGHRPARRLHARGDREAAVAVPDDRRGGARRMGRGRAAAIRSWRSRCPTRRCDWCRQRTLLRTEGTPGASLLDRRVVTRQYGRRILDSLPPFREVAEMNGASVSPRC
jgi:ATP-dependent DNA helicase DinG